MDRMNMLKRYLKQLRENPEPVSDGDLASILWDTFQGYINESKKQYTFTTTRKELEQELIGTKLDNLLPAIDLLYKNNFITKYKVNSPKITITLNSHRTYNSQHAINVW